VTKFLKKVYRKAFNLKQKTPYKCPVCATKNIRFNSLPEKYLRAFDRTGFVHSIFLFETLNIFQYSCSNCNASDRERLYAMYLSKEIFGNGSKEIKVLDIAPVQQLTAFLKKHLSDSNYRTADLFMKGVDDNIDIQHMDIYEDSSWDFVICSHVLEHVKNDEKALSEIYRVLKPGGRAILMAPINLGLNESVEAAPDKTYTEDERWKYFGQDDHERLYAKQDFIDRITNANFKVNQLGIDYFGEDLFKTFGIHKRSILYIGEKL